jgi:hypothetical protein
MTDDLVEKVARALNDAESALPLDEHTGAWRLFKIDQARAALRVVRDALAEPGEAMLAAGASDMDTPSTPIYSNEADIVWRAMLAAHPIWRVE